MPEANSAPLPSNSRLPPNPWAGIITVPSTIPHAVAPTPRAAVRIGRSAGEALGLHLGSGKLWEKGDHDSRGVGTMVLCGSPGAGAQDAVSALQALKPVLPSLRCGLLRKTSAPPSLAWRPGSDPVPIAPAPVLPVDLLRQGPRPVSWGPGMDPEGPGHTAQSRS